MIFIFILFLFFFINSTVNLCTDTVHSAHILQSPPTLRFFMRTKRVVMKFDKLLSVIVRRCEQHVYNKLTSKRPTDTDTQLLPLVIISPLHNKQDYKWTY